MYPYDERFNCRTGAKGLYNRTGNYVYLFDKKKINQDKAKVPEESYTARVVEEGC